MNTRLILLIAASSALLGASPLPSVLPEVLPAVTVSEGQLTVHSEDSPLTEVLVNIGQQAGFSTMLMAGSEAIRELKVNDDFVDLPLDQGLKRLLHGWNYALLSDKTSGTAQKLFILGKEGEATVAGPAVSLSVPTALNNAALSAEQKAVEDQIALAQAAAEPVLAPVIADFKSDQPAARLAALSNLDNGGVDDSALLNLRQLAETDSDPEVRAAALEQLMRYDTSGEAQSVLTRLASGPEGPSRDIAKMHLQRSADEAAAMAAVLSPDKY